MKLEEAIKQLEAPAVCGSRMPHKVHTEHEGYTYSCPGLADNSKRLKELRALQTLNVRWQHELKYVRQTNTQGLVDLFDCLLSLLFAKEGLER